MKKTNIIVLLIFINALMGCASGPPEPPQPDRSVMFPLNTEDSMKEINKKVEEDRHG